MGSQGGAGYLPAILHTMTRLLSAPLNAYDAVLFKASSVPVMPCRCFNVSSGAAMIITRLAHYRNIYHQQFTIAASIIPMSQLTIARCVPNKRQQGCISCGTCSYPKLTEDHVLTSAYVKIFKTVTRNSIDKNV